MLKMVPFHQIKRFIPIRVKSPIKRLYLHFLYLRFKYQAGVQLARGTKIDERTRLDPHTSIYPGCDISGSSIGSGTYIAAHSSIRNTKVGRFCSIGSNVTTCLGAHPTHSFVSTHPAFFLLPRRPASLL